MKKLNKKGIISQSENVAEQNVAIGPGGYVVYILVAAIVASILYITATVIKLGCSCRCTCATNKATMLANAGYGNNAVTMAR